MDFSRVSYIGDGQSNSFVIPFDFLHISHIKANINNVATTAFSISAVGNIIFNTTPRLGEPILIYRETPLTLNVDFEDGNGIKESELDRIYRQLLYKTQELKDISNEAATQEQVDAAAASAAIAQASVIEALNQANLAANWASLIQARILTIAELEGDGSTDNYDIIFDALTDIGNEETQITLLPGIYRLSSSIVFPDNVSLVFVKGAKLLADSGVIVSGLNIIAGLDEIFLGEGTFTSGSRMGYVFPEWYGAKANGVTDNSVALQKAIDFADTNSNKILKLISGTYAFSQTLNLPSFIGFEGLGKKNSILFYTGMVKAISAGERVTAPYGTATFYNSFKDLMLKGTNKQGIGLYITSHYMDMERVDIQEFDTGIDCAYCWSNKYNEVLFYDMNTHIKSGYQFNANSFINCIFSTGEKAVSFTQGAGINFTGCQFENIDVSVFYFEHLAYIFSLNVRGCYFENYGTVAKTLDDVLMPGFNFAGNYVCIKPDSEANPAIGLAFDFSSLTTGTISGEVKSNTWVRNNSDSTEPFFALAIGAKLLFENNPGYTMPSYNAISVMFTANTIANNTSYVEKNTGYSNRETSSGQGKFTKGIIIGTTAPAETPEGFLLYLSSNKLFKYHDSGGVVRILQSNMSGTTAQRPTAVSNYQMYFDTTIGKPIWYIGSVWKDAAGNTV